MSSISSNIQRFNKHNLCPICGKDSGCGVIDNQLYLCLRTINDISPEGFKIIGEAQNGMGSILVRSHVENHVNKGDWEEQQRDKKRVEKERQKRLLSIAERDQNFQKLVAKLSLKEEHKINLERRGMAIAEVERTNEIGWMRSWEPGKLVEGISDRLPGIHPISKRLVGKKGMVIFLRNVKGQILGGEIALDKRSPGMKYNPLSSNWCEGNGPQLPNGELPISVWRSRKSVNVKAIWLTEGHQKSLIAATKVWRTNQDITVIGRSVIGSSFESTIEAIKELDCQTITIQVDGGAIKNHHVLNAYLTNYEMVMRSLPKCDIRFGWWEQIEKSNNDIDELDSFDRIQRLDINSFFNKIEKYLDVKYAKVLEKRFGYLRYSIVRNRQEPNAIAYKKYIEQEQAEEDILLSQSIEELFQTAYGLLNKEATKEENLGGHTAKNPDSSSTERSAIKYSTGCLPIDITEFNKFPDIKLKFLPHQREEIFQEAIRKNYKYILDRSGTGSGKSTSYAKFDFEKGIYFSPDHRNPTTKEVEETFYDLPVRHNGMHYDGDRTTPLGKHYTVHPKKGDSIDTKGNCERTAIFRAMHEKNINVEGADSTICLNCPVLMDCRKGGFKHQRAIALKQDKIRMNILSAPDPKSFDYSKYIGIHDECSTWLKNYTQILVSKKDLEQTIAALAIACPDLFSRVHNLLATLDRLFSDKKGKYGFDDPKTRSLLPNEFDEILASELAQLIEVALYPNLDFLNSMDEIDYSSLSERDKKGIKRFNQALKRHTAQEESEVSKLIDDKVAKFWLPSLLRILANAEAGSLRLGYDGLTILVKDTRQQKVISSLKSNIFLDATYHPDDIAKALGIERNELLVIEQIGSEQVLPQNVSVIQIVNVGQCSKQRSNYAKAQLDILYKIIVQQYKNPAFFDWKLFAKSGWGYFFGTSRGSNNYQKCDALICTGAPTINLGAKAAEWQMLSGESVDINNQSAEFKAYYDRCFQAEVWQTCGRLRANRRPDEALTIIFIYERDDFSFDFLGDVLQVDAGEIHPEAGDRKTKKLWLISNAIKELASSGLKITQAAVAKLADLCQSAVSDLVKTIWKQIIKFTIDTTTSVFDIYGELKEMHETQLSQESQAIADDITENILPALTESPEDLPQAIEEMAELFTWPVVVAAFIASPWAIKTKILSILLAHVHFEPDFPLIE